MPDTPRTTVIEVSSEVTPEGAYVLTVRPTPDVSISLGRDRAIRYGLSVLTAVRYADYEAAVWAQMHAAGPGEMGAWLALTALREQRRALDHEATAPLTFDPILSSTTRTGMIRVLLDGRQIAQLETAAAAEHAHGVLGILAVAELDALYYRWLRDGVTDEPTARHIIGDLAKHHSGWLARPGAPGGR